MKPTLPTPWCLTCFAVTDDLVDHARDRYGRVDDSTDFRYFFFRSMQPHDQLPFRSTPAPLILRSLVKPPVQCVKVDLENKHLVKQIDEFWEVPRTTAKECYGFILVDDQGFHRVYMPDVVFVHGKAGDALHRFTSLRIALISQLTVTIKGMVAAPLQLFTDRGLTRTGDAFDQEILLPIAR